MAPMKNLIITSLSLCVSGLVVDAGTFSGFSGEFATSNFTLNTNGGDGSVNLGGAPASIALSGSNADTNAMVDTDYTITVATDTMLSFNWSYSTEDSAASYDPAYYVINGASNLIFDDSLSISGSGAVSSIVLNAGDTFGFRVKTIDDSLGRATLTITGVVGTNPIPEPSTYAAVAGIGALVSVAYRRRIRR